MAQKRETRRDQKSRDGSPGGAEAGQPAEGASQAAVNPDAAAMETIRELLFGQRADSLEEATGLLAARLDEDLSKTRTDLRLQIERLGEDLSKQLSDLGDRLSTEISDRARLGRELAAQLDETDTVLRTMLSEESDRLTDRIEARHQSAMAQLANDLAALSDAKADRDAVAGLLDNMANKLRS